MKYTTLEYQTMSFFRKLPDDMKVIVDISVSKEFDDEDLMKLQENKQLLETIYKLTPEMAKHISDNRDDYFYFQIKWLFDIIQPVLEDFFQRENYYTKYPEYLV